MEASTNTSLFLPRFYEALQCYGTVLQPDSQFQKITEQLHFREKIRDVGVHDGEERIRRQERIGLFSGFEHV